ncbi:MAG: gamma-glutamyltransferase family protein [Polyangiaceae bacterium]
MSSTAALSFDQPYRSPRQPVLGRQAVATSHPAAAQVGMSVLERGGNAIDAAIAVAATLSVVEPTMNGLGGDLFALVWDGSKLHGLNASGRAPDAWSPARFAGLTRMPELGWDSVTVPGAVSGWAALWQRFGSEPFARLMEPAIGYALHGFPVPPKMAALWARAGERFGNFQEFRRVFLPEGRSPRAGEWFRLPDLGESLSAVAESTGRDFYEGRLARRIADAAKRAEAALTFEDLARHEANWVDPISVRFRDARLFELPPNGQGLAALIALGILQHRSEAERAPEDPDSVHVQIEAMKLAFTDCRQHVADPRRMRLSIEELLAESRLAALAKRIELGRAEPHAPGPTRDHGTVYATTACRSGKMVSLIQSNYLGFGSGVVVPGTGISLQNRGLGFSLEADHPNRVQGGMRPYHTIMPGFLLSSGEPLLSFGVMGGHMQPQGHVQLTLRSLLHGQNPQALCDAPRWYVGEESEVALEPELARHVEPSLRVRGHRIVDQPDSLLFGGAQVIQRIPGGYCAGSDPRKDGQALGC